MKIENNVFLITGGASGLGEGAARLIVAKGGKAVLLDRDEERGKETAASIGPSALFLVVDVTKEESVKTAIQKSVEKFGAIHGVINCAGIGGAQKIFSKGRVMPKQFVDTVLAINLGGTFNVIRFAVEQMAKQNPQGQDAERGVIINVASVAAFDGQNGQTAYSASKGGIVAMTLPLARDLGDLGIRAMTIAPGIMETPLISRMTPQVRGNLAESVVYPKRLGTAEDFALLCAAIIECSYLNGEVIRLDGGIRMSKL